MAMTQHLLAEDETDRPTLTLIQGGAQATSTEHKREQFLSEVEELVPALYPRAMQLCRDSDMAADLIQDTVERALRFQEQYTLGSNLKAWLGQVLFSIFITGRRKASRERKALDSLTADPCAWMKKEQSPMLTELPASMKAAVVKLPQAFGMAVVLVDLHGLSYKEAAEQLGVPVGTVMSRLHRGRRMLRDALPKEAA